MKLDDQVVQAFVSLFWISLAAVVAALAASATRRRVPDVVWLLSLGMAIGPAGLGLAGVNGGVELLKELGLGFLFLIAGFHIRHDTLTGRRGRWVFGLWAISIASAFGVMMVLLRGENNAVLTSTAFAIAMTSTALGALVPVLTDTGEMDKPMGAWVMAHGAAGEFGPIISISLLLTSRSPISSAAVLLVFVIGAVAGVIVPSRIFMKIPRVGKMIVDGTQTTSVTTFRIIFLVLTGLLGLSAVLGLDIVLGSFTAGIIVRALVPASFASELERNLRNTGYSFLIPVFFVASGMGIDWRALLRFPLQILGIVAMIFVFRGGPILLAELAGWTGSGLRGFKEKARLALFAAPGLPIIVAVTGIARSTGLLSATMASMMIIAGAITVLIFPTAAKALGGVKPQSLDVSAAQATLRMETAEAIRRRVEAEMDRKANPRRSRFRQRKAADAVGGSTPARRLGISGQRLGGSAVTGRLRALGQRLGGSAATGRLGASASSGRSECSTSTRNGGVAGKWSASRGSDLPRSLGSPGTYGSFRHSKRGKKG